ncbi:plasma membrane intrinsic protein [Scenedesmus sp. NREL 46B-D3]|nr:plasma membrane intrinsic protein [Scenedesmus sp. NREL 46B-D3]
MWSLLSAGLAEFFCTAAFVFIATGTVTSGCHTADTARQSGATTAELETVEPGACFLGSSNLLNIALSFGLSIFVLVYAAASFSGGHLNPAITIAMFLARRISLIRAFVYVICQLAGAIVGSALVRAVDPFGFRAALGASNRLNSWANVGTGLGAELILTAIFVFVVFAAVDQTRGANSAHLPVLAPLAIGIVVFLAHVVAIPIDGCSVNPARSFGTAVVSRTWQHHWIFWVGPIVGGAAAGLLYEALAYRAPIFGGPVEKLHRVPGTSPAGPQEYTV